MQNKVDLEARNRVGLAARNTQNILTNHNRPGVLGLCRIRLVKKRETQKNILTNQNRPGLQGLCGIRGS